MPRKKEILDPVMVARKANELIQRARCNLSLTQQKILLYLIAQISPNDTEFKAITFNIADFGKACGVQAVGGSYYENLKRDMKAISDKSFWVLMPDGYIELARWFEPRINRHSGKVEIEFGKIVKPYLLQLKQNFTEIRIDYPLKFKKQYSVRLYELLCSYHFHKNDTYSRTFEIEELKDELLMTMEDSKEKYLDLKDFRKRCLYPAIEEINLTTDKHIAISYRKMGRQITHIQFTVTQKEYIDVTCEPE